MAGGTSFRVPDSAQIFGYWIESRALAGKKLVTESAIINEFIFGEE